MDFPCSLTLPAAAYHADPAPRPSLSASIAKLLLRESPYHAWLRHPRFGGVPEEATREMDRGTIIHALVLGTPLDTVVIDADNYRTKAAQEARDKAHADGKTPVLAREWGSLQITADAVKEELELQGIRLAGKSEQVVLWEEPSAYGPVLCRGMIDHLHLADANGHIYDLKTTVCAHPDACIRTIVQFGYDLQQAAYTSAITQLRPDLAGRLSWRWLFVEELPRGSPKRVALTVAEPSGLLRELGARKWARAVELWAQCLAADAWPLYAAAPIPLEPPAWAMQEGGIA